jgi:hypothetical protein
MRKVDATEQMRTMSADTMYMKSLGVHDLGDAADLCAMEVATHLRRISTRKSYVRLKSSAAENTEGALCRGKLDCIGKILICTRESNLLMSAFLTDEKSRSRLIGQKRY